MSTASQPGVPNTAKQRRSESLLPDEFTIMLDNRAPESRKRPFPRLSVHYLLAEAS